MLKVDVRGAAKQIARHDMACPGTQEATIGALFMRVLDSAVSQSEYLRRHYGNVEWHGNKEWMQSLKSLPWL